MPGKMQGAFIFAAAALMLAGCDAITKPVGTTMANINRRFDGSDIKEFIYHYGQPISDGDNQTGGKVYHWISGCSASMAETYQCSVHEPYCEIALYTNSRDSITHIDLVQDSLDSHGPSHCSYILSGTVFPPGL